MEVAIAHYDVEGYGNGECDELGLETQRIIMVELDYRHFHGLISLMPDSTQVYSLGAREKHWREQLCGAALIGSEMNVMARCTNFAYSRGRGQSARSIFSSNVDVAQGVCSSVS